MRRSLQLLSFLFGVGLIAASPTTSLPALHWRFIGQLRGGRTVAVSGVAQHPNRFYIASVNGGVWRSNDAGRSWTPIFDGEPSGSVGALAVAPSDPKVIYVGSGEGLRRPDLAVGDGIYRSTDAGAHWEHLGLRSGEQIQHIAVDPQNANRLFVAVLGHPYGPNAQRGLYRSTDGGTHFTRVLGGGPDLGAVDVRIDPRNPQIVFAALWASRNGPWNLQTVYEHPHEDGLFKSSDGGTTWTKLTNGLPMGVGRIGIAIAPSNDRRIYAVVAHGFACGIYRSDNAGSSWRRTDAENRVCGRTEDFAELAVDPRDPNTLYSVNTSTWRSRDGGTTWTAMKGAPGGDDYHTVWVDPAAPSHIILGSDQGATISVDGGATWSSWYNQPTAEMYHVNVSSGYPYWVCGGQQESGSACVRNYGPWGEITMRDWMTAGAQEYGYVVPDPLHAHRFFGGKLERFNSRTGQVLEVSPDVMPYGPNLNSKDRYDRTAPIAFGHINKHALYYGSDVVFRSLDAGRHWKRISPNLAHKHLVVPRTLGSFTNQVNAKNAQLGVVYSIAPSYKRAGTLWAGTDDGLLWLTRDGGAHWHNVTPPGLSRWSKISQIDAGRFNDASAYVAVTRFRLNDMHPYIYVTHDYGAHWRLAVSGLPMQPVNAVREDNKRPGLLYAGTENGVAVSFDDGARWQSLQLNLPHTSVRDLVVHLNDLVVATHGRGFWILDDLAPLRELKPSTLAARAHLFTPASAYRLRRSTNTDTPLPPETPTGMNPPYGALIDYSLARPAKSVVVEILDAHGGVLRRYANDEAARPAMPGLDKPSWWERPETRPGASAGFHRIAWDLHGTPPRSIAYDLPISAVPHKTPQIPQGALAPPGRYTVRLIVDGKAQERSLLLRPDPQIHLTAATYAAQFALAERIVAAMNRSAVGFLAAKQAHDAKAARVWANLNGELGALLPIVDGVDAAPTAATRSFASKLERQTLHR
ncbi:MAG TPA: glycoside hydrolase [Candidatus Dormibacteraeota bacterium]|nr:glycoside hydrolase [Candidatus Dormibacteraeota bacterium]